MSGPVPTGGVYAFGAFYSSRNNSVTRMFGTSARSTFPFLHCWNCSTTTVEVWRFDLSSLQRTNLTSTVENLPSNGRTAFANGWFGSREEFVIFGGLVGSQLAAVSAADTLIYFPRNNSIVNITSYSGSAPSARAWSAHYVYGENLYVFGGRWGQVL